MEEQRWSSSSRSQPLGGADAWNGGREGLASTAGEDSEAVFFLFPFLHLVFAIQVNVLEDQIDGQTRRTEEVEKSLRERQTECRRLEELAAKERRERTAQELRTGELKTEVDHKPLLE